MIIMNDAEKSWCYLYQGAETSCVCAMSVPKECKESRTEGVYCRYLCSLGEYICLLLIIYSKISLIYIFIDIIYIFKSTLWSQVFIQRI